MPSLLIKLIILRKGTPAIFRKGAGQLFLGWTPPCAESFSLLFIHSTAGMADYAPQRPIRGGKLSHSDSATIHHANIEHGHHAQVHHSLLYYTLVSKLCKNLLLITVDIFMKNSHNNRNGTPVG